MALLNTVLVAVLIIGLSSADDIRNAPKPRSIDWSSKTYGPDGPWQAVSIGLGTPLQQIDLFPGGAWVSNILNTSVCGNTQLTPVCYANKAGLFDSKASSTFIQFDQTGGPKNGSADGFAVSLAEYGANMWAFDTLDLGHNQEQQHVTIPSFDLLFQIEAYSTLPDGSVYTMEVGNLALGAQDLNQTWQRGNGQSQINGTFLPNYLYAINQTNSSSYGLHIGSVPMGIPGSLWLGGYDQSRVLGSVSQQKYGSTWLPIDLIDIGIDVAEGQSPFNFTSKSGLLAHGNASMGVKQEVWVDPTIPYLYLAQSTCDAITADLPVKFDSRLGLYLWQTQDPRYTQIISAPSLLTFTFRLNSSVVQNFTINVPFSLLNLTLTAPLTDTPTQYFPCRPSNTPVYYLGRAFLQAAFIGVNWMELSGHNGVWWLAQAPGPNTPSIPAITPIQQNDHNLIASSNNWTDTWKGAWTAISPTGSPASSSSSPSSPSPSPTSTGLSTTTIAAIGTAISVIAIAAILTLFFYLRGWFSASRRRAPSKTQHPSPFAYLSGRGPGSSSNTSHGSWTGKDDDDDNDNDKGRAEAGWGPREIEGRETREPVELGLGLPHRVLGSRPVAGAGQTHRQTQRFELGNTQRPAELDGGGDYGYSALSEPPVPGGGADARASRGERVGGKLLMGRRGRGGEGAMF